MAPENEKGEEILDKTPIALPIGYERPEPLEAMVARMVRAASAHSAAMGNETIEEANDFGSDEEEDEVKTPYQYQTMEEEYLDEKPRTNPEGPRARAIINNQDSGKNGNKVSEIGTRADGPEKGSNEVSHYGRRAEDRKHEPQSAPRRRAADNNETAGRQGSRTDL